MKLGVLGGGQLGRMLALAGIPMGVNFRFLDPAEAPCAAAVGEHVRADYDDLAGLDALADGMDAVTYEFENVPAAAAAHLARRTALAPGAASLAAAQDRASEKQLFEDLDIPLGRWAAVESLAELRAAVADVGLPAVLKTRRFGYDGKGQAVIRGADEMDAAWQAVGEVPCVLEAFVAFEREVSMIGVRAADGTYLSYPLTENIHVDGILRQSIPRTGDPLHAPAADALHRVMRTLDHVGVMAFEFFVDDGALLANEVAPRVHNSGHWTIDGAATSQFENHVRAVLGLPLGDTAQRQPCAMLNAIGALPDHHALAALDGVRIHDYGKIPRDGRKVGHINILAATPAELDARLQAAQALLS